LQLVRLYAERGSPKYEKAALRWLERYLREAAPRLPRFAEIAADLANPELRTDGFDPEGVCDFASRYR
jgi:hypothetical protein